MRKKERKKKRKMGRRKREGKERGAEGRKNEKQPSLARKVFKMEANLGLIIITLSFMGSLWHKFHGCRPKSDQRRRENSGYPEAQSGQWSTECYRRRKGIVEPGRKRRSIGIPIRASDAHLLGRHIRQARARLYSHLLFVSISNHIM